MIEIELDIFSGRENPKWILSQQEERELVDRLRAEPEQLSDVAGPEQFSLGYRGLLVRNIKTDDGPWNRAIATGAPALPDEFRVGVRQPGGGSVSEWLLATSEQPRKHSGVTDELREVVAQGIAQVESVQEAATPARTGETRTTEVTGEPGPGDRFPVISGEGAHTPGGVAADTTIEGAVWWACPSNYFTANADVFNRPENVGRNNCYCFASNHLAGVRYALPGRRGGQPATSITCGGVTQGLYADGWRDGCQQNGLTIVLVIWPNVDYHFYRLVTGGPYWWWGHKPGGTPAKYTDDCGHAIYQYQGQGYAPNNICRGPYTDFCGYFYQDNYTAFVA